jgi:hypothetical protein
MSNVAIGLRLAAALAITATLSSCGKTPGQDASVNSSGHAPSSIAVQDNHERAPELTRIVIDDNWGGYNPKSPFRSHWVIEPRGAGFVLNGTHSEQHMAGPPAHYGRTDERDEEKVQAMALPSAAVEALVRALRAPPESRIDLALFGPAVNHAGTTIDQTVQRLLVLNPAPALRQRIVDWGNSLRQGQPLADAITLGVATAYHSDDHPYARIQASFADGSSLVFCSDSQNLLMLPWRDVSGRKTFSADLPRALAALLPPMSSDHGRLSEVPSQDELDDYLGTGMGDDYSRFQVQIVAPDAYAALQSHFIIRDINPVETKSHGSFVTVGLPAGPSNLSLRTRLVVAGTALAKPADLDGMMDELNTAVAATGLRQAMKAAPDDEFRIERGVGWQPFKAKARKQFITQMNQAHKLPELAVHPDLLDGAVMVEQGRNPTYWVALRDRRAVQWKRFVMGKAPAGHRLCAGVPFSEDNFPGMGNLDDCLGQVYDASGKAL